ncbi:hypothetical protein Tco_0236589 [Tanacetum coccineum]
MLAPPLYALHLMEAYFAIPRQEMHADLKYIESLEDELDEVESDKAEFSNMYDMFLQEYVSKDVMCSYLQSSSDLDEITELKCLYLYKVRACDCLVQKLSEQTKFVSKEIYTELLWSFAKLEKHSISLEIALQEYQARPTKKHLKEVKRIFRYLRGTIHMGLWYPKGFGFELTAFSDADHAGCIDTRKSTSGGIQFLGDKKQNCTAISSAEAEYVALSASCAQVMWMRTQLQDYGFNYDMCEIHISVYT